MNINFDSQLITNRPENVFYFSGVANAQAAYDYIGAHTTHDHQVGCFMTLNEDGEGSRCDENSTWYVITAEELSSEFFTKASLSPEGQMLLDQIIEEEKNQKTEEPVANT